MSKVRDDFQYMLGAIRHFTDELHITSWEAGHYGAPTDIQDELGRRARTFYASGEATGSMFSRACNEMIATGRMKPPAQDSKEIKESVEQLVCAKV